MVSLTPLASAETVCPKASIPQVRLLQGLALLLWRLLVLMCLNEQISDPTGFLESRAGYLQPEEGFCPLHT